MGWHISYLDNTVKIPKKAVKELDAWALENGFIYEGDSIVYQGKLYFNPDHMEHMDYIWQDGFADLAKKHKLNGDVTFGSLDGDNSGDFWGYRFTKGEMQKLTGEIVWKTDDN